MIRLSGTPVAIGRAGGEQCRLGIAHNQGTIALTVAVPQTDARTLHVGLPDGREAKPAFQVLSV